MRYKRDFAVPVPYLPSALQGIEADLLTMAEGIADGSPIGTFAVSGAVAARIELGDHGGTYCGNLIKNLFVRQTQGNMIRIFPPLTIRREDMGAGVNIIEAALRAVM